MTPPTPAPDARTLAHPARDAIALAAVLHALADPMRLQVVRTLARAGHAVACGACDIPVSKSTTTHHFRVLREAGLIHQYYRGTAKMNELRRADLDALFPGLLDSVLRADHAEADRAAAAPRAVAATAAAAPLTASAPR